VDAEDALKPALDEIGREVSRIMAAIESVPDEMGKTVLTLRYIEGLDWLKISESIGYEISNTYIIHGRALVAVNRWLESRKALEGSISW
jgi:DNA-directed RNA polymerase specialized sigma24 family protein